MPCEKLKKAFKTPKAKTEKNTQKALNNIINYNKKRHLICILGSHYFGPHIKTFLKNKSFALNF